MKVIFGSKSQAFEVPISHSRLSFIDVRFLSLLLLTRPVVNEINARP